MFRTYFLVTMLFSLGDVSPGFAEPVSLPQRNVALDVEGFKNVVVPFLETHCTSCHGERSPAGGLSLVAVNLGGLTAGDDAPMWLSVLERVASGNMPPASKARPKALESAKVVGWIRQSLLQTGHARSLEFPEKGNHLPHELLFGDAAKLDSKPASPMRIWRVSPYQYEGLWADAGLFGSRSKDLKRYELARRTVPDPFSLRGGVGFQDFAMLYRIDEAETEQLLLNARVIANKLLGVQPSKTGTGEIARQAPKPYLEVFNSTSKPTAAQVRAVLSQTFRTVLRREPDPDEFAGHARFLEAQLAKYGNQIGLKNAIAAVVLHPESLYRLELGNGQADEFGRVLLAPRELAFAIAYGLTDGPPDAELIEASANGKLKNRDDVAREVRRLLDNPEIAKPRILRFFQEYFGYAAAPLVFKDGKVFVPESRKILVEDTDRFVRSVLAEDRDVLRELLTSNRLFNAKSSAAKELKAVQAYGFPAGVYDKPFDMPKDQRAGILTHPSWLIAHSAADDNDVVRRGKWVRERLLGGTIPEVPVTVAAQVPDEPRQTLRHRMRVTREKFCLQCHQSMDPLGLAFEMFDDWGRFRTKEIVPADRADEGKRGGKKPKPDAGVPVDSSGEIIGAADPSLNGKVANAIELTQRLAKSEYVHQVFVRHAFRYWMGRNETPEDAPTLQNAYKAYKENGGSMKALMYRC